VANDDYNRNKRHHHYPNMNDGLQPTYNVFVPTPANAPAAKAVKPRAEKAENPVVSPKSTGGMGDIREWDEERFGVSAERLRNCIVYQLDHSDDDWFDGKITRSSMNREGFVRKLDEDTPVGWTPDYRGRVLPMPLLLAEKLMKGPGVNEPVEGWTSAKQKWGAIKRSWYGAGWEAQPDPDIPLDSYFSFYQDNLGISKVYGNE
jgi:hypothetical protein